MHRQHPCRNDSMGMSKKAGFRLHLQVYSGKRRVKQTDYVPYIITEAFCILFSAFLLFRLRKGISSDNGIQILRVLFLLNIILLTADILYALTEAEFLNPPPLISAAINATIIPKVAASTVAIETDMYERTARFGIESSGCRFIAIPPVQENGSCHPYKEKNGSAYIFQLPKGCSSVSGLALSPETAPFSALQTEQYPLNVQQEFLYYCFGSTPR